LTISISISISQLDVERSNITRRKASAPTMIGRRASLPQASWRGERMSPKASWRRERSCRRTLFCNRAARVKGSKLAPAPRMVVWQGPLFCPRSARAAAASWGQARARRINLRECVVADRASSSGHRRGFVDVTAAPRPCRTLPPERNS
jgi:hypothetical protein